MFETIGQQLRQARERRSLSLEQVAQSTRMRLRYLQALEAGEFTALPSLAQARGFLRTYANFLGLDGEALLGGLEAGAETAAGDVQILGREKMAAKTPDAADEALAASTMEARAIFEELGQRLQRQRELLGISLEDVARHTHLRVHYLRALECGNLDDLPSPVQGRGMLKNYAAFLGLDPEPLLLRFAEGLQARLVVKQAARETAAAPERLPGAATRPPSTLRRLLSGDLLIGGVLILFLAAFVIWGAIRVYTIRSDQQPTSTAPSVAELMAQNGTASPSPTTLATPTQGTPAPLNTQAPSEGSVSPEVETTGAGVAAGPEGEEASPSLTPPPVASGAVQIYVTARQRAWMRVTVDGEVEFEGRVIPGSAYQFGGENQVEILTGNGAALQIFFNQQDLGPLGLFGQVVQRVFTPSGVQTATPTITPTGTPTPRPTATLEGTPTLQSFITATP